MSRAEPKAGEWLRQQIDELGALRNASVRDPQFKAWRQNTLTFIQRIWPGDTTKSERFRRVPFTPPSTRHDARTGREYYERGCGEALEYLNWLLASLGEAGTAPAPTVVDRHPESFEGDFPEVDLGGAPSPPVGAAPPAALDDRPELDRQGPPAARGQGPPELPVSAGRPVAPGSSGDFLASAAFLDPEAESPGNLPPAGAKPLPTRTPFEPSPMVSNDEPAPAVTSDPRTPRVEMSDEAAPPVVKNDDPAGPSRISVRGATPRRESESSRVNPLRDILDRARAQEAAGKEAARNEPPALPKNGKQGKKAKVPKPRLKDMLGLSSLEHEAAEMPEPPPTPATHDVDVTRETPRAAEPEAPVEPIAPPAPIAPVVKAEPPAWRPAVAPRAREIPDAPEGLDSPDAAVFAGGVEKSGGWSLPEFMTPAETPPPAIDVTPEPTVVEHEPLPASHVESLPSAEIEEAPPTGDEDTGDAARVTAEFLDKSPVLSSVPRPVHRRSASGVHGDRPAESSPHGTAAGRLLAIAAEVDRLGVPEGHRARARAALMDLARQLDDQDVAWDVLREAIHFVMEFPPLARKTLPLLLPFLDLAA